MPRNKSEALPKCPQAHAYANAAEAWLRAKDPERLPYTYWDSIPIRIRDEIGANTSKAGDIGNGRRVRIAYIRETYGT